jgi:hypothetical protein
MRDDAQDKAEQRNHKEKNEEQGSLHRWLNWIVMTLAQAEGLSRACGLKR